MRGVQDAGVYASLAEIAAAEKLSPSYVSRIARLALLAPDIIEAILAGTLNQGVVLDRLEKGVPVVWEEQRAFLRTSSHDDPNARFPTFTSQTVITDAPHSGNSLIKR